MVGNQSRGRMNFGRGAQDRRRGRGRGPPPEAHGRGHAITSEGVAQGAGERTLRGQIAELPLTKVLRHQRARGATLLLVVGAGVPRSVSTLPRLRLQQKAPLVSLAPLALGVPDSKHMENADKGLEPIRTSPSTLMMTNRASKKESARNRV